MNKSTCLILLVLASFAATAPRNTLKAGLWKVFRKWQHDDMSSLPFTLPSLRDININRQERYCNGYTLTLDNAVLQGFESLTVENLSVAETDSGLTASLVISVPWLKITAGWYKLVGHDWNFLANSNGYYFRSTIYNLRLTASMSFEGDGSNTVLRNLNLNYAYNYTSSYLQDPAPFVNMQFNGNLQKCLNNKKYWIGEARTLIGNTVNSVLRGYTPEQLKTIIREVQ